MDREFSEAVKALRAPMCLLVVFIHTSVLDTPLAKLVASKVWDISSVAVPFFFFVAGYFFFAKVGDKFSFAFYKQQLTKRFWSLVVPYVCWTSVALIFTFATMKVFFHGGACEGLDNALKHNGLVGGVMRCFWGLGVFEEYDNMLGWHCIHLTPFDGVLWFVRDLIVMCVISPIVYYAAKYLRGLFLVTTVVFFYTKFWQTTGFHCNALVFFSLGAYISVHNIHIVETLKRYRWLLLTISFSLWMLPCDDLPIWASKLLSRSHIPVYMATFFAFAHIFCCDSNVVKRVGDESFFVYVMHGTPLVVTNIAAYSYHILAFPYRFVYGDLIQNIYSTIAFLATPIMCIVLCMFASNLLNMYAPKVKPLLSGGR